MQLTTKQREMVQAIRDFGFCMRTTHADGSVWWTVGGTRFALSTGESLRRRGLLWKDNAAQFAQRFVLA